MPSEDLLQRYVRNMLALLPTGRGLTRAEGSSVYQLTEGLATELARVHERTDAARSEMIPWMAVEMLPDWEALLGITEPAAVLEERQAAVRARILGDGAPTRPGFEAIAASLGYIITWMRDAPFECGRARIGHRIGGERRIYTWEAGYQVGGANDALLEELLLTYAGEHAGGVLAPTPLDLEATFRGGQGELLISGPDVDGWTNAGDIDPLPESLVATPVQLATLLGVSWADFDGSSQMATASDVWTEYVGDESKWAVVVAQIDSGTCTLVSGGVAAGIEWGIGVLDFGSGPEAAAFSADGGSGVLTTGIPLEYGVVYVMELLHSAGTLTARVYDDTNGWREESTAAPATVGGAELFYAGFGLDGRMAYLATYGVRGFVPPRAQRETITTQLVQTYAQVPPFADRLELWLSLDSPDTSIVSGDVAVLGDMSGHARHASQATTTKRPSYNASDAAFGGRASFSGDGIDDVLITPSWNASGTAITYVLVMRGGGGTGSANERLIQHDKFAFRFNTPGAPRARYINTGTTERQYVVTPADPKRMIIVVDTSTPSTALTAWYIDGVDASTSVSAAATVSGLAAATLRLLGQDTTPTNPSDATIAEAFAFRGALTSGEAVVLDAWLAARFS